MLDTFYISFFNLLKPKLKRKAIPFSLIYISIVEFIFYGLLVIFFMAFANQMHLINIAPVKLLGFGLVMAFVVYFKNWMRYSGKRRNVLNAKSSKRHIPTWKLITFPLICLFLSVILYQAI